jgi:DMSO/TMAO reductase YedYZ molybdopterin-dependent catalytic subunit
MEHVLDPSNEVMLTWEMNGEALPAEHGYPVRMVTPGCIAVRSPKWVSSLIISDEEADSAPQRRDYRVVKDVADINTVNWNNYPAVYWHPINSGIGYPVQGTKVNGVFEVAGWAHGDGLTGT